MLRGPDEPKWKRRRRIAALHKCGSVVCRISHRMRFTALQMCVNLGHFDSDSLVVNSEDDHDEAATFEAIT